MVKFISVLQKEVSLVDDVLMWTFTGLKYNLHMINV